MCPTFRVSPAEEATPRAKANFLRGVLTGRLGLSSLNSDEFNAVAESVRTLPHVPLGVPGRVDIPRLMRESKGAYVAATGLTMADWFMTRLDLLGAAAWLCSWLANWALGNRADALAPGENAGYRARPQAAPRGARSFLRRARSGRRLTRPSRRGGQKVLYFVDVYANYFDPQLAEAFVAVLEHNGIDVYVHPEQSQAGMAAIARGALDYARRAAA